ncbi:3-dehydroquinate synthase [Sphingosinicella sp.]|uniref:3-dehydroquinate synthase n=1 Tax=Sphingosinicella sp. TaxID=1917971 RepID=UPI00403804E8
MIRIDAGGYAITIGTGLLGRAPLPGVRKFLVTDANVAHAGWPDRLGEDFAAQHVLTPGEGHKTLAELERLTDALLDRHIERSDLIVALGGGMVGDVAGFAAALIKRGCRLVQIPTSLLAMADSAIGGKTGVNTRHGKNLLGAFHPAEAVLIDLKTLVTLPEVELRAGYAEIVKYGLIGDAAFFAWCEGHGRTLLAGDEAARLRAIETCVRAKLSYVTGDERDATGRRALLNFGHSFGHAIEAESGMAHGLAVAIGMAMALRLSHALGLCPAEDVSRVAAHFAEVALPAQPTGLDPEALLARMAQDKKATGGRIRLVLTGGIGRAFLCDDVATEKLAGFLADETARAWPPLRSAAPAR